ncbi:hypothetical protein BZG36_01904 [Bifiguratus adelaidae]|uniref:Uncharacterized protein n=1 Tax=Bifiguratus adelaidae TaxID=1938954 RepID=A0A261Y4Y3_9FUNG|nr:hypothetical protein BZG36_01904 [Bifiguratus adelaidae]
MERTFPQILRHSRLSTYDNSIPQVYRSTTKHKKHGDWGLKRNLPTVIRTPNICVRALDTNESQTPWDSATSQVELLQRWKENFGGSNAQPKRTETVVRSMSDLSETEWKKVKRQAREKREQWLEAVKEGKYKREQVLEFLQLSTHRNVSQNAVAGPTYGEYPQEKPHTIQGRVLNTETGGYAVGVAGFVAHMPQHTVGVSRLKSDRELRTFHVLDAKVNEDGVPKIELSYRPPRNRALNNIIADLSFLANKKGNQKAGEDDEIEKTQRHLEGKYRRPTTRSARNASSAKEMENPMEGILEFLKAHHKDKTPDQGIGYSEIMNDLFSRDSLKKQKK